MQLGIFAKTYERPDVEGVFAAVRADGLDCVQFNMSCAGLASMPDEIDPAVVARIRAAAQAAGVTIASLSGTYNMIHPDPLARRRGLNSLRGLAAACHGLGTGVITLCTGTRDPENMWRRHPENDSRAAWADLVSEMAAAVRIAEEYQVTLAFEPEHANVINSARRARALLDELRSPRLKVVMDGANLIEPGGDQQQVLQEAFDLLGADIAIAHAKDRTPDGGFCAAGQGIFDYACFLRLLQAGSFSGPLIVHGLGEDEVAASLASIRALLG
jgi:sugar phosphate isomerase/epimerase